jgi:uncharacterized protein (TIGR00255 family)
MICSMTAFGRVHESGDWGSAICEIRTVNHRYLETGIRLGDELRALEPQVRERIAARIGRGKVDCLLRYDAVPEQFLQLNVNHDLARRVLAAAQSLPLQPAAPIGPLDVLRWPGVLARAEPDLEVLGARLLALLDAALDQVIETRRREGAKLRQLLEERIGTLHAVLDRLTPQLPAIAAAIRERWLARVRESGVELNAERLEQEMLIVAQKMDVAEELDRLRTHLAELARIIGQSEPVGRRLDFLMQELNREANTLGSKAAGIDMSNASVDLKVLIEQMREQIQNIE